MNDLEIENLLRKAPTPRVPQGLCERLKADIRLPQADTEHAPRTPFWRRWFPALSFGVLLLGCFIALAVQTSQFLELRRESESLRAATADIDQLRQDNAELQRSRAIAEEGKRSPKEQEELLRLRAEVEQLRAETKELAALKAENQRLEASRAASAAAVGGADRKSTRLNS